MENVKIFATPEAYELLLKSNSGLEIQKAVHEAIKLALGSSEPTLDHFITKSPLAISAIWAKKLNEISYILIYKHVGFPHYYGFCESLFLEQVEKSIQISLN